tara:strand:+ start:8265 stop:8981 length:717 start_codon:yes stop_codon:yes gene_type:complete
VTDNQSKAFYDTVFVSDVHLGARCNHTKFLKFLGELKTKKIVFVGDIIDIYCMEKYKTRWVAEDTECVHKIIKHMQNGVEVVYIPGNHEAKIRRYGDFKHKNFKMVDEYIHKTKGKKYICTHGDKYSKFSSGSWKQLIFNKGYEIITPISLWLERIFQFSLVYQLKNTIDGKKFIDQYENDIAQHCIDLGNYDGIICGHIHHANIRRIGSVDYMCCGDFVDSCTALVEKDGYFHHIKY